MAALGRSVVFVAQTAFGEERFANEEEVDAGEAFPHCLECEEVR